MSLKPMSIIKQVKDYLVKYLWDSENLVPAGLFELSQYSKNYGSISFDHREEDGNIIAISRDFKYGSIIATAKDEAELDGNIKDAILTSFEIPSSYAKEAKIKRVGHENREYALA